MWICGLYTYNKIITIKNVKNIYNIKKAKGGSLYWKM